MPIIALTANALSEERKKAMEAGMNEWCTKPIRRGEVSKLLNQITRRASTESSSLLLPRTNSQRTQSKSVSLPASPSPALTTTYQNGIAPANLTTALQSNKDELPRYVRSGRRLNQTQETRQTPSELLLNTVTPNDLRSFTHIIEDTTLTQAPLNNITIIANESVPLLQR